MNFDLSSPDCDVVKIFQEYYVYKLETARYYENQEAEYEIDLKHRNLEYWMCQFMGFGYGDQSLDTVELLAKQLVFIWAKMGLISERKVRPIYDFTDKGIKLGNEHKLLHNGGIK